MDASEVAQPRSESHAEPQPASDRPQTRGWVDYGAELRIVKQPALRALFVAAGLVAVGLAVLGYILPGMPGTVFILIATWFFAQSSPRFYNWVLNHPRFGPLIRDYRAGRGIPRWVKFYAPLMIVLFSAFSVYYVGVRKGNTVVGVIIAAVALFGVWYVLHVPTKAPAVARE